jgi:hypothetical protein
MVDDFCKPRFAFIALTTYVITMGRIMTPLLKLPLTRVVIKVNIKRCRFMQL